MRPQLIETLALLIGFGILALLALIAYRLTQRTTRIILDPKLKQDMDDLVASFHHHLEVSAVVKLLREFEADPELAKQLSAYSQQVVDAANLLLVNSLGSDLEMTAEELSNTRRRALTNTYFDPDVTRLEMEQIRLYTLLDNANARIAARKAE